MKSKKIIDIDEQLRWITSLFNKYKINYMLDCGTLLGVLRDGKLIDWEKDIDFAIFEGDIKKMDNVLKQAKLKGYKMGTSKYKGLITGFKISPDNFFYNLLYPAIPLNKIKGNRTIDIAVLREKGDFLWKPLLFSKGSDKTGFIFWAYKIIRGINRILKRLFKIPMVKGFSKTGTRLVPKEYFKKSRLYGGLRIPYMAEEYLNFKYGKWKTPVKNWSYMRDDMSCKKINPEKIIQKKK
jgi:lipopolysaccharide cholinephosphotransferase